MNNVVLKKLKIDLFVTNSAHFSGSTSYWDISSQVQRLTGDISVQDIYFRIDIDVDTFPNLMHGNQSQSTITSRILSIVENNLICTLYNVKICSGRNEKILVCTLISQLFLNTDKVLKRKQTIVYKFFITLSHLNVIYVFPPSLTDFGQVSPQDGLGPAA